MLGINYRVANQRLEASATGTLPSSSIHFFTNAADLRWRSREFGGRPIWRRNRDRGVPTANKVKVERLAARRGDRVWAVGSKSTLSNWRWTCLSTSKRY